MEDDPTVFGAPPGRLAKLLHVGVDTQQDHQIPPDELKEDLLKARLAGAMLDQNTVDDLQAVWGRLRTQLLPMAGRPLGEALLDETTRLDDIRGIKRYGKDLAERNGSGAEHAVAIAIYYAAIASALLFHGLKITSHSYADLADAMATLVDKRWIPAELARHFAKARKLCNERAAT